MPSGPVSRRNAHSSACGQGARYAGASSAVGMGAIAKERATDCSCCIGAYRPSVRRTSSPIYEDVLMGRAQCEWCKSIDVRIGVLVEGR
jgi:hypothetical protein